MQVLTGSTMGPPRDLVLTGKHIRLQPVAAKADVDELFEAASGSPQKEEVWAYMPYGPFPEKEDFLEYLTSAEKNEVIVPFVVVDIASNRKIGIVTFMNIVPANRCIEIGGIWYTPEFHRTYANTESSYLLIKYAFDELQYRRVEWKCHSLNEKSKNAAKALGFIFEGVLRQHFIVKGKNRDTVYFSILDGEWPAVKTSLEAKIEK